ncbi:hypothetical protein EJ08DRAFT_419585 [Tothia fuscella]|uniref:Uncharacterized protein n=1 Tax=Tothia fuscella TaxID=1048955 RepID=A0A9P4NK31_9PEZI|nr:hypothetical protein EJ08DRAFT_419585 [Tothia fuscella]
MLKMLLKVWGAEERPGVDREQRELVIRITYCEKRRVIKPRFRMLASTISSIPRSVVRCFSETIIFTVGFSSNGETGWTRVQGITPPITRWIPPTEPYIEGSPGPASFILRSNLRTTNFRLCLVRIESMNLGDEHTTALGHSRLRQRKQCDAKHICVGESVGCDSSFSFHLDACFSRSGRTARLMEDAGRRRSSAACAHGGMFRILDGCHKSILESRASLSLALLLLSDVF